MFPFINVTFVRRFRCGTICILNGSCVLRAFSSFCMCALSLFFHNSIHWRWTFDVAYYRDYIYIYIYMYVVAQLLHVLSISNFSLTHQPSTCYIWKPMHIINGWLILSPNTYFVISFIMYPSQKGLMICSSTRNLMCMIRFSNYLHSFSICK